MIICIVLIYHFLKNEFDEEVLFGKGNSIGKVKRVPFILKISLNYVFPPKFQPHLGCPKRFTEEKFRDA